MNTKRTLETSPTDNLFSQNSKKHQTSKKMSQNDESDVFSWTKMKNVLEDTLEEKLIDVVRKEDLNSIKKELEDVKNENLQLKKELKKLNTRIELIDRKTRSTNVVVNGLKASNSQAAKEEFQKLCTDILKVDIDVGNTSMLSKTSFIFNINSNTAVNKVLNAKGNLKGRNEFIQKDYTPQEQHVRYHLRQLTKIIRNKNRTISIKQAEFNVYIDNKKFGWFNDNIIAYSENDSDFLCNILKDTGFIFNIVVRDIQNRKNVKGNE